MKQLASIFYMKGESMSNKSLSNETIITTLKEIISILCMGCGCSSGHCLDIDVLEYLIKEKEGDLSGK